MKTEYNKIERFFESFCNVVGYITLTLFLFALMYGIIALSVKLTIKHFFS